MLLHRKLIFTVVFACCLAVPACFHRDLHSDAPKSRDVFVPETIVIGNMSPTDALALTGDSELPGDADIGATGDYVLTENETGLVIDGTLMREQLSDRLADRLDGTLVYSYEDHGLISSFKVVENEEFIYDFLMGYEIRDGITVRRTATNQNGGAPYLDTLVVAAEEGDSVFVKQYNYLEEDAFDAGHDESGDPVDKLMRAYYDGQGRLVRQVFYSTVDPALADNETARYVVKFAYNAEGDMTKQSIFHFYLDNPYDGNPDALDSEHESFRSEYRMIYDGKGNLKYWIMDVGEEDIYGFVAFTWTPQTLSAQAADFLEHEVRLIDTHPEHYYHEGSIVPLLALLNLVVK